MGKQGRTTKLSSLSVVLPAFNDEKAIPVLVGKALLILPQIAREYEIIIVNDGSKDKTGLVLKKLQKEMPYLRVITHQTNQGYGAALVDGFAKAKKDFIFYTDSDGQYDVEELKKLTAAMDKETDVITGFKLQRADPWYRQMIGSFYNQVVKLFFQLRVKDVDCDFRLFRRQVLKGINFQIKSGAFDVELVKKLQEKGARFKELGVHHYPRIYGQSQFFNFKRIMTSFWDLGRIYFQNN